MKISNKDKEEIFRLYKSGSSTTEISRIFNVDCSAILYWLKQLKINIRKSSEYRKLSIDQDYFFRIDSKDKAYFLGLLMADGCLSTSRYSVLISLKEDDKQILEIFKRHINYGGSLKYRNRSFSKGNFKNSKLHTNAMEKIYVILDLHLNPQ